MNSSREDYLTLTRVKLMREASSVKRCHAIPTIGHYDIGQHSFGMLCLLFTLNPNPSINLVRAIMAHDFPERFTGDIPAPGKWLGILNIGATERVEDCIIEFLGFSVSLSDIEKSWLKGLDMLEYFLWTEDQIVLGNSNVTLNRRTALDWLLDESNQIPEKIRWFTMLVVTYRWKRLSDTPTEDML